MPDKHGGTRSFRPRVGPAELKIEILRKSIHLLIAAVPFLASLDRAGTILLLALGTSAYALLEALRIRGTAFPLVSRITVMAARRRDEGRYILGPVTLGLGALLSLVLFGEPAASVAIYALAFGDGVSSLAGKWIGRVTLPHTRGKSLEGSVACFAVTFVSASLCTGAPLPSLIVAAVATVVEAVPTRDWDNILLPLAVGLAALMAY